MKVFIADESDIVRECLVALVSDLWEGELVGQAKNAQEAIEPIQQLRPDVVMLDIRMPGSQDIQAIETIKKNAAAPVVIALAAFPYPQYRKKCLEAGADYFFDKCTEITKIIQVIKDARGNGTDKPASTPESQTIAGTSDA